MRPAAILAIVALCLPGLAVAGVGAPDLSPPSSATPGKTVLHGKPDRGWFFYDDPVPPPPPPKLKPVAPSPPSSSKPAEPTVGSAAWIRANIQKIRDRAIDNPTRQNVELYAYVQRLMMDKSQVFAENFVNDVAANPYLDESATHPTSGVANFAMGVQRDAGLSTVLRKLSQHVAVWYFFQSSCEYCQREAPLLLDLTKMFGIDIVPISLDDRAATDGSFASNWIPDEGQGRMLGVTATPAMFLVNVDTRQVVFMANGLRALPDMEDRIVRVAKAESWIDQSEFDRAESGAADVFLTDTFDPSKVKDPNNPQDLLAAFKAAGHSPLARQTSLSQLQTSGMVSQKETLWMGK